MKFINKTEYFSKRYGFHHIFSSAPRNTVRFFELNFMYVLNKPFSNCVPFDWLLSHVTMVEFLR